MGSNQSKPDNASLAGGNPACGVGINCFAGSDTSSDSYRVNCFAGSDTNPEARRTGGTGGTLSSGGMSEEERRAVERRRSRRESRRRRSEMLGRLKERTDNDGARSHSGETIAEEDGDVVQ